MVIRSLAAGLCIASGAAAQVTRFVNRDCGDDAWTGLNPVCAAPGGPKRTIQAAIGASVNGDTVAVADGVYTGTGNKNLSFGGRRVVLRAQNGPAACILDMQGTGRAFFMADLQTPDTVVEGFTIRNGNSTSGGAFWFHHRCDITVRNCIITGNSASIGGGAYVETDARPTFVACTFAGNTGASGGALAITQAAQVTVVNCVFTGNTATDRGGAVFVSGTPASALVNCTIAGNSAANRAGGLCVASGNVAVSNGIVWGNTAPVGAQASVGLTESTAVAALSVAYSTLQGGQGAIEVAGVGALTWLNGNLALDPLFVAPTNLRLSPGSPAIDAASNPAVPAGISSDRDGQTRFVDDPATPDTGIPGGLGGPAIVDMGAYEFQPSVCYANCDGSTAAPVLNVADFTCFLTKFAAGDPWANCDASTALPTLNVADFTCFLTRFASGCN